MSRTLASIAVPAAIALILTGCAHQPERPELSPLTAAELAPVVGTYACALYADRKRHPGPRGTLVIHRDGAYALTQNDGTNGPAGIIVSISPPYEDQDRVVVFSGEMHSMLLDPPRHTLRVVFKSKSAFVCARSFAHPSTSSG